MIKTTSEHRRVKGLVQADEPEERRYKQRDTHRARDMPIYLNLVLAAIEMTAREVVSSTEWSTILKKHRVSNEREVQLPTQKAREAKTKRLTRNASTSR